MNTLGTETKHKFFLDPEAHKLSISFVVATGQKVYKGDPVILATDGKVQAAGAAAPAYTVIGHSIHDGDAGEDVTIVMKAYTVVWGEAAAAGQNAGAVETGAYNTTSGYRAYAAATGSATPDDLTRGKVTVGHALENAAAAGDLIKVALL